MMSFFVSVTCICAAMALVGMLFETDTTFGYEVFLSPLIFGAIASLPLIVKYSSRELSLKQTAIRNIIHFILLEVTILITLYLIGALKSVSVTISLASSILMIYITVNLVLWINDKRTAREFNNALKILQNNNDTEN
jgi:uncharacterized membrane protein